MFIYTHIIYLYIELLTFGTYCCHQRRMCMAERVDGDAGQGIEVFAAIRIPHTAASAMRERHRQSAIGVHEVGRHRCAPQATRDQARHEKRPAVATIASHRPGAPILKVAPKWPTTTGSRRPGAHLCMLQCSSFAAQCPCRRLYPCPVEPNSGQLSGRSVCCLRLPSACHRPNRANFSFKASPATDAHFGPATGLSAWPVPCRAFARRAQPSAPTSATRRIAFRA